MIRHQRVIKALACALPVEATSNWEADFVFFSETGADKDIRNVNHTVQDVNNEVKDLVGAPSHPKFLWYLYYTTKVDHQTTSKISKLSDDRPWSWNRR